MPFGVRNKYIFTLMAVLSTILFLANLSSLYSSRVVRSRDTKNLTFFAVGDIGGTGRKPFSTRTQRQVAKTMGKAAELHDVSIIIGLGDNFYPHGVKNAEDPRFKTTFEKVYSAPALMRAKWLMVAGNHDYEGNITAQLEYSKKSSRWYFPSLYYTKVYRISSNSVLQLVIIDTKLLCSHSSKRQIYRSTPSRKEHRQWVEKILRSSKADYLIVAGHNPIFSAGVHGGSSCLLSFLKPLLDKYDVTAYVSGHDHNFQHIKEDGKKVNYFVSGNGNYHDMGRPEKIRSFKNILKIIYGSSGGYTMLSASSLSLGVTHVNKRGKSIYTTEIMPRKTLNT